VGEQLLDNVRHRSGQDEGHSLSIVSDMKMDGG
jgi:hypothetical protein